MTLAAWIVRVVVAALAIPGVVLVAVAMQLDEVADRLRDMAE